ncbi:hypothetical protein KC315_g7046 [Hortaea werneckii]|nr:hypothetical protein KC315_g7046 [Hortaea werneckii]
MAETSKDGSLDNGVRVSGESKQKTSPPESPAVTWTRSWIIFAFWAIVACLGLPHWIWTTSIHRSDLPLDAMNSWADGQACQMKYPLKIKLDTTDDNEAVRSNKEEILTHLQSEFLLTNKLPLYDVSIAPSHFNESFGPEQETDGDLIINVQNESKLPFQTSLRSLSPVMDVRANLREPQAAAHLIFEEILKNFDDEQLSLSNLLSGSPFASGSEALLSPEQKAKLDARTTRAFKYASTYHLTFSLFSASSSPSAWDIDAAIDKYISPLVGQLSAISSFSVDTQVQLHATFSPSIAGPQFDEASRKWKLVKTDLSGFINAAEWPLSPSIGTGPTINFVLYVPSKEQSPLEIAETGGTSWLIPQWGGVQILNPSNKQTKNLSSDELEQVMLTFADQLTSLVGLPPSPSSLALRLSSMVRERATSLILASSSTLGALSRLTLKLTSIAIPDSVAEAVDETIGRLDQACVDLREGRFESALSNARIANDEVERAFFEPSMVGQVYFPDEHKVAVYVPLLGPMAVPLVMAGIKQLKNLKSGKMKSA